MSNIAYQNHVGHCFAFLLDNSARVLSAKFVLYQILCCTHHFGLWTIIPQGNLFFFFFPHHHLACMNMWLECWTSFLVQVPLFLFQLEMQANVKAIKVFPNKKLSTEYCSGHAGFLQQCPSPGSELRSTTDRGLLWETSCKESGRLYFVMGWG